MLLQAVQGKWFLSASKLIYSTAVKPNQPVFSDSCCKILKVKVSDQDNKAPTPPETALKDTSSKPDPIVFLEEDEDLDSHYEKSLQGFHEEEIVSGKVTDITDDFVTVDIGFKSDCLITSNEFHNKEGVLEVAIGDEVEVYVEALRRTKTV